MKSRLRFNLHNKDLEDEYYAVREETNFMVGSIGVNDANQIVYMSMDEFEYSIEDLNEIIKHVKERKIKHEARQS